MEQDAGNKNIKIGFAEIAVAAAIYAFCKSIYLILVYYNTIPHFELMFLKLDVELPAITQTVISLRGSGNALILIVLGVLPGVILLARRSVGGVMFAYIVVSTLLMELWYHICVHAMYAPFFTIIERLNA